MSHAGNHAELTLPLGIEEILPALGNVLRIHILRVICWQNDLIREGHGSVVVVNRLWAHAEGAVVERDMKLAFPNRSVQRIDKHHDVPLGRVSRGGFADVFAHVRRHAARLGIIDLDGGAEFLVEGVLELFSSFRRQRARRVKFQHAFFLGGGDQLVHRGRV